MRAKLRSDAERHAAACEAQYERALAQAVADLDAQHVRQVYYARTYTVTVVPLH
jgi:hypothetical protein